MKAHLICDALTMATLQRQTKASLLHHSDRGSQYASKAFNQLLKTLGAPCARLDPAQESHSQGSHKWLDG